MAEGTHSDLCSQCTGWVNCNSEDGRCSVCFRGVHFGMFTYEEKMLTDCFLFILRGWTGPSVKAPFSEIRISAWGTKNALTLRISFSSLLIWEMFLNVLFARLIKLCVSDTQDSRPNYVLCNVHEITTSLFFQSGLTSGCSSYHVFLINFFYSACSNTWSWQKSFLGFLRTSSRCKGQERERK